MSDGQTENKPIRTAGPTVNVSKEESAVFDAAQAFVDAWRSDGAYRTKLISLSAAIKTLEAAEARREKMIASVAAIIGRVPTPGEYRCLERLFKDGDA